MSAWQPMNTAPKDGSSFVAWCVQPIGDGTPDKRIYPVSARWIEARQDWVWRPLFPGPRGGLTAWVAKPHPEFNCLHENERWQDNVVCGVLVCDDCGVMLEDHTPPASMKGTLQ